MSDSPYAPQPTGTPPAAQASLPGKGLVIAGILVAVAGIVLGIVSFVLLVGGAVGAAMNQLTAPEFDASTATSLHLDSGDYTVFRQSDGVPLGASDLQVVGPDGQAQTLASADGAETIDRSGYRYESFATFTAATTGDYTISTTSFYGGSATVIVAPSTIAAVTHRAGWGFGILGGGLLLVVGVVLLVVGLTHRRRARTETGSYAGGYPQAYGQPYAQAYPVQPAAYPAQPAAYPAQPAAGQLPAAGWYPDPDPSRPGGRRYWDGSAWTNHTA